MLALLLLYLAPINWEKREYVAASVVLVCFIVHIWTRDS